MNELCRAQAQAINLNNNHPIKDTLSSRRPQEAPPMRVVLMKNSKRVVNQAPKQPVAIHPHRKDVDVNNPSTFLKHSLRSPMSEGNA